MKGHLQSLDGPVGFDEGAAEHLGLDAPTRHVVESHHAVTRGGQLTPLAGVKRGHSRPRGGRPYLAMVTVVFKLSIHFVTIPTTVGARCSSVVRAFADGAMGHQIDPSWGKEGRKKGFI